MQWLLAALSGIAFVELILRLPFFPTLDKFRRILSRVSTVIRSDRISDHWKEKILPRYALSMLRTTLAVAGCLIAAFLPFLACVAIAQMLEVPFLAFSMSWLGIVFITLVAIAYAKLRSVLVPA